MCWCATGALQAWLAERGAIIAQIQQVLQSATDGTDGATSSKKAKRGSGVGTHGAQLGLGGRATAASTMLMADPVAAIAQAAAAHAKGKLGGSSSSGGGVATEAAEAPSAMEAALGHEAFGDMDPAEERRTQQEIAAMEDQIAREQACTRIARTRCIRTASVQHVCKPSVPLHLCRSDRRCTSRGARARTVGGSFSTPLGPSSVGCYQSRQRHVAGGRQHW